MKFTILTVGIAMFTAVYAKYLQLDDGCGKKPPICDSGLKCEKGVCKRKLEFECAKGSDCVSK